EAEAQHPIGAGLLAARRDLAGERRFMTLVRQDPAREGNFLPQVPFGSQKMLLHLPGGAFVVRFFRSDYRHIFFLEREYSQSLSRGGLRAAKRNASRSTRAPSTGNMGERRDERCYGPAD